MSETQQTEKEGATEGTTTESGRVVDRAKKLSIKSFGGGRAPGPTENGHAYIGTIKGQCNGVRVVTNVDQQTGEVKEYLSLTGEFYGQPADGSKPLIRSGTLYLPGGFHEEMADHVAPPDDKGDRKPNGNLVTFSYDVFCIPASNKSGYSYQIRPVFERKRNGNVDLLAELDKAEGHARSENPTLLQHAGHVTAENMKAEAHKADQEKREKAKGQKKVA